MVARGFVGPARWIKTETSKEHQKNTLEYTPELYLDSPGPVTEGAMKLMENERIAINAVYDGDRSKAMMAGGECAQRIEDLPLVADMVQEIVTDAEAIIKNMPSVLK